MELIGWFRLYGLVRIIEKIRLEAVSDRESIYLMIRGIR
jgi:hypothetical protein